MQDDPRRNRRRSIRLKGFDYSRPGCYFVTICTQHRACLLGDVVDGGVRLTAAGGMVQGVWDELSVRYSGVETDSFVVMPNHVHGIVVLTGDPSGMSLAEVVHRFKTLTTRQYAAGVRNLGWPAFHGRLWLRNYYEHLIRDRTSLDRIREYIATNPARWAEDPENPAASPQPETAFGQTNGGQPRGVAPTTPPPKSNR
jgi:putative transposase